MTSTDPLGANGSPISFSLSLDDDVIDRSTQSSAAVIGGLGTSTPTPPPPPSAPISATPVNHVGATVSTTAPALNHTQITALANEVAAALAAYDATNIDPAIAAGARDLLIEFEQLRAGGVSEEQRQAAWTRVSHARQRFADSLGDEPTKPAVADDVVVQGRRLQAELSDAEARARRPMSGPGAFKKFAAARRAFELFLVEQGVESLDELTGRSSGGDVAQQLQAITEELHAAEAAWNEIELRASGGPLADTPAADAFRVRVYRLVGSVIDDVAIEPELRRLASVTGVEVAQAKQRMEFALGALGFPTDGDPIAAARQVAEQIRR